MSWYWNRYSRVGWINLLFWFSLTPMISGWGQVAGFQASPFLAPGSHPILLHPLLLNQHQVTGEVLAFSSSGKASKAGVNEGISSPGVGTDPAPSGARIGVQEVVEVERPPSGELATESDNKIQWAVNGGLRTYHSTNVTRISGSRQTANVVEVSAGANAIFPKIQFGTSQASFTPSLSIMSQRAYFGQYKLGGKDWGSKDARILDYEFHLASLSAEFEARDDWKVVLTAEYDELRNFHEGSKLYHAFIPSVAVSRIFPIRDDLAALLDTRFRYASSQTVMPYKIQGVFDDDGDNLQTSFNLSLMRTMGPEGKLLLMPTFGFNRTGYLKNQNTGRVDYLLLAGVSASYRLKPWLSPQVFANYGHKFANEKGEKLLEPFAFKYDNWDMGIALTANHSF